MLGFKPSEDLRRVREAAPLVHNITNFVAMNPMANILLAVGCSPAMLHAPQEVGEFAAIANALTINIGTLSSPWLDAMLIAAKSAIGHQKPWVLDPVAVGATRFRQQAARLLLDLHPTVIRGNASEILALYAGENPAAGQDSAGRGVDASHSVVAATAAAVSLAKARHAVVVVTGPVDWVTDGQRGARIANGHAMMPKVTALGCSLTGVIAGFVGAGCDPFAGTVSALAYYGVAAELAVSDADNRVRGPGSFSVAFLDALANLEPHSLDQLARVEMVADVSELTA